MNPGISLGKSNCRKHNGLFYHHLCAHQIKTQGNSLFIYLNNYYLCGKSFFWQSSIHLVVVGCRLRREEHQSLWGHEVSCLKVKGFLNECRGSPSSLEENMLKGTSVRKQGINQGNLPHNLSLVYAVSIKLIGLPPSFVNLWWHCGMWGFRKQS